MKPEFIEVKPQITISKGKFLGIGMRCFNLPNNNCGVAEIDGKISLCRNGAGRNTNGCNGCTQKKLCKGAVICKCATIICNNRCYQNNCLTEGVRTTVYGNYCATLQDDFVSKMTEQIREKVIEKKIRYFRIHSLGEFYSYKYFCDWMEIARKFNTDELIFVAYTKCFQFLKKYIKERSAEGEEHPIPQNVKIMLSIMPDSLYGSKSEIENGDFGEEELRARKEDNIRLIRYLLDKINADVYLTTYEELYGKILTKGVDWLPERSVMECGLHNNGLHNNKKCTDCINENQGRGMESGCYMLDNKDGRRRVIVEKIRVTKGKADYESDMMIIEKCNKEMAALIKGEIREIEI